MVWWPFAVALQGEIANHREVRRSRAGVLSIAETARYQRVRCGSRRRAKAIPLLRRRKRRDGIKTEASRYLGMSLGDNLPTAQMVPGIKVARAWLRLWCGTWEPVVSKVTLGLGERPVRSSKGELQAAETARGRVPMRGTGADCPVVVTKPGNAGGAKRAGCSGRFGGQPPRGGRSR